MYVWTYYYDERDVMFSLFAYMYSILLSTHVVKTSICMDHNT
jgi:hypothetical protein